VKPTFEKAIKALEDNPNFQVIVSQIKDQRETHITELSAFENAGNPQVLAYLAGSISTLDLILKGIDDCKQ
jgi:hypothetical protein